MREHFAFDKTDDSCSNSKQRSKSLSESRDSCESKQPEMEASTSLEPKPPSDESSSCEKLLNFAQNFSFLNGIKQPPEVKKEILEPTNRTDTSPANTDTKQKR